MSATSAELVLSRMITWFFLSFIPLNTGKNSCKITALCTFCHRWPPRLHQPARKTLCRVARVVNNIDHWSIISFFCWKSWKVNHLSYSWNTIKVLKMFNYKELTHINVSFIIQMYCSDKYFFHIFVLIISRWLIDNWSMEKNLSR